MGEPVFCSMLIIRNSEMEIRDISLYFPQKPAKDIAPVNII